MYHTIELILLVNFCSYAIIHKNWTLKRFPLYGINYQSIQQFFALVPGFFDDYHLSHDHLGFIGGDRNATVAAHSMYVPPSMFNLPMPPPQHYNQVSSHSEHLRMHVQLAY